MCKNICSVQRNFYKGNINTIEQQGATVKIEYLFFHDGKYSKTPNFKKRSTLMICSSIYPTKNSKLQAERTHTCQHYYSKVGVIKKKNISTYWLCINKHEDKGMTTFFKRYSNRLMKKTANIALKHRLLDVIVNTVFPKRYGSSFNKTYRGFPIKAIFIIISLLMLFLIRLATPTGYHPILK